MDAHALREVARGSAMPLACVAAIVAGFVLMRLAAIGESYLLLALSFVLMVGGFFTLIFRQKRVDDWAE